ncbi:MAG: pyrroline-5-carboxylate reductase [Oscillospiraceae bacterium]|nr:pyrroline-5-carboxylate reductase [Oscillospiraceae bacterium]
MKYGFIGLGNMAGAIIEGMAASGKFEAGSILGFNRSPEKTMALAEECGLIPCESASDLVGKCDVIILAVKPQVMPEVMEEIGASVSGKQTVLTIAAGKNTAWYEERFENKVPVVRIMPNINAKVKMAVSGVCGGCFADEESIKIADEVFSTVGSVYHIEEKLFPAFSALGGASGAFVLLYIDALAEAGVRAGFSRPIAEEIAAATAVGSATLCMADGAHPIAIMNRICSPGGTTVEGVIKLRELGFETAVQQGLQAIIDKDSRL